MTHLPDERATLDAKTYAEKYWPVDDYAYEHGISRLAFYSGAKAMADSVRGEILTLKCALEYCATQTEIFHDASQPQWVTSHRPTKFALAARGALEKLGRGV